MEYLYFKNLATPGLDTQPIECILDKIQTDPIIAMNTIAARGYLKDDKIKKYREYKKYKLPAFIPCAHFNGQVNKKSISSMTGLCFLDIDHLDAKTMEEAQLFLNCDSHIYVAFRSLSGRGFHILVRYSFELPENTHLTAQWMRAAYEGIHKDIAGFYHDKCGLDIDFRSNNIERACGIAHDPFALYNPDPEPFNYNCVEHIILGHQKGIETFDVPERNYPFSA